MWYRRRFDVSRTAADKHVRIVFDGAMERAKVWLNGELIGERDLQCMKRHDKAFSDCTSPQQMELVDEIAWPGKAKPGMEQGVSFFNLMRDLSATGFYTSQIGIKDLGYAGNKPNQWDGVPQDVLDQYGVKYDERTLAESIKFDA